MAPWTDSDTITRGSSRISPMAFSWLQNSRNTLPHLFQSTNTRSFFFKSVAILMHDVSNNISPPQTSNSFNYQHNIHLYNKRSSARGNFFLKYSRINKQNMSLLRNGVRSTNSLSMNFVKCLKRNLNATFTICSFRNSRGQINVFIYQIWTCLENRTYYICIILPASHLICLIFLRDFFPEMLYWSIFNY